MERDQGERGDKAEGWKEAAQQGGPEFTYAGLLQAHLGPAEGELARLVERAKGKYAYETILRATADAADEHRKTYTRELEAFERLIGIAGVALVMS